MAALIAVAESAQDVASSLHKFLDGVPESTTEITGLIAECFAISSALRELSTAIGDYGFNRRYELIAEDVRTVRLSLDYTFEDVLKLFGGLGRSTYRQVWRDLDLHFLTESRNSLLTRLGYYRNFLMGLARIIAGLVLFQTSSIAHPLTFGVFLGYPSITQNMRIWNTKSKRC